MRQRIALSYKDGYFISRLGSFLQQFFSVNGLDDTPLKSQKVLIGYDEVQLYFFFSLPVANMNVFNEFLFLYNQYGSH